MLGITHWRRNTSRERDLVNRCNIANWKKMKQVKENCMKQIHHNSVAYSISSVSKIWSIFLGSVTSFEQCSLCVICNIVSYPMRMLFSQHDGQSGRNISSYKTVQYQYNTSNSGSSVQGKIVPWSFIDLGYHFMFWKWNKNLKHCDIWMLHRF